MSIQDVAESKIQFTKRDDYSFAPAWQVWDVLAPFVTEMENPGPHGGWLIRGVQSSQWEVDLKLPGKTFRTLRAQKGTVPLRTVDIILHDLDVHFRSTNIDIICNSRPQARRMAIDYYAAVCPDVEPTSLKIRQKTAEFMTQHCIALGRLYSEAFPTDFKRVQAKGYALALA